MGAMAGALDGKRGFSETEVEPGGPGGLSAAIGLLAEPAARLCEDTTVGGRSGRRDRWLGGGNEGESTIMDGKVAPLPAVGTGGPEELGKDDDSTIVEVKGCEAASFCGWVGLGALREGESETARERRSEDSGAEVCEGVVPDVLVDCGCFFSTTASARADGSFGDERST